MIRSGKPSQHTQNERSWRLEMEEDCTTWDNTEVSNVVLPAWTNYPAVLQASHAKPSSDAPMSETVDTTYTTVHTRLEMDKGKHKKTKVPLVIGEMKRGLINREQWQMGTLSSGQRKLSQELRG